MDRYRYTLLLILLLPIIAAGIGSYLAEREVLNSSLIQVSLGAGLLCGVSALFAHYLRSRITHSILLLSIFIVTILTRLTIKSPVNLISLLMVNLVFGYVNHLMIIKVFYHKDLARIRTLFVGLGGGVIFGVYLPYLYSLVGVHYENVFSTFFMFGLIVYVFIAFAMSMADLIIIKSEVEELQSQQSYDEDESDQ
ncbi:MAG TPA: hypothetical protein GXX77_06215 [Candidatus Cloacimonetes bacterium]|nr:hypothetical protein [Candidatus Cloacimonadota bacterium]